MEKVITDYCSGFPITKIAELNKITFNSAFDISRGRFSELLNIDKNILENLKFAKLNSKKRRKVKKEGQGRQNNKKQGGKACRRGKKEERE